MTSWSSLKDEFDRWNETGEVATFWWRDDDAVSDTEHLERLLDCAGQVPVALAVIPDLAELSLARKLAHHASVTVLQHGWRHCNHAQAMGRPSEYPAGRDRSEVAKEFDAGHHKLTDLFGEQSLPVFVPPWNNFHKSYLALLARSGLKAISRGDRPRCDAIVSDLAVSNIHCEPMLWGEPPTFGSDEKHLRAILCHLEGRRQGLCDASEPTGMLTHHLKLPACSYAFMAKLAAKVSKHSAARWLDARDVFKLRRE